MEYPVHFHLSFDLATHTIFFALSFFFLDTLFYCSLTLEFRCNLATCTLFFFWGLSFPFWDFTKSFLINLLLSHNSVSVPNSSRVDRGAQHCLLLILLRGMFLFLCHLDFQISRAAIEVNFPPNSIVFLLISIRQRLDLRSLNNH